MTDLDTTKPFRAPKTPFNLVFFRFFARVMELTFRAFSVLAVFLIGQSINYDLCTNYMQCVNYFDREYPGMNDSICRIHLIFWLCVWWLADNLHSRCDHRCSRCCAAQRANRFIYDYYYCSSKFIAKDIGSLAYVSHTLRIFHWNYTNRLARLFFTSDVKK